MSKAAVHSNPANTHKAPLSNASTLQRQHSLGAHVCIQREASGLGVQPHASALVRHVLNSPGQPLDPKTRSLMEPRLGHDFSGVRVHTDREAAESARAISATAYTVGTHVTFGAGQYQPGSHSGEQILAHELTHVVQQSSGPVAGTLIGGGVSISRSGDHFEQQASAASDAFSRGSRPTRSISVRAPFETTASNGSAISVQRQDQPNAKLADAGAVLGIIGGAAGVLGLGLAALAYFRPPEALNPAPVTGGISINPNPFSFNTMQQTPSLPQVTPVPEPKSNQARFRQAQKGPPKVQKVLDLRTDDKNHAELNVALRTDGYNVVDASIRTGAMQNYLGGSRGSSATVNFSATQTTPAPNIFTAPEPTASPTGKSEPGPTEQQSAATQPSTKGEQAASQPSEAAEVMVSFTGTNTRNQDPPQTFAGSFTVSGKGDIDVSQPEVINGVGTAGKAANVAEIDYRGPDIGAASASSGESILAPSDPGGGLSPEKYLPFNKPMTD